MTNSPAHDVPHRPLGRTGQQVSAIGLGGFHLGKPNVDEQLAIRMMRSALDAGVNFMDNCWDYHEGESEKRMGKALRDGYRERAFVMTKIDGRSKQEAARQLDESLRRLKVDYIDLVQHHEIIRYEDPHRIFAEDGANAALVEAQRAGKLRFIGFTGHKDPAIHLYMLDVAQQHGFHFDAVQMPLNVLDVHYRSFAKQVLPRLVREGIGVLGMKPLASGLVMRTNTVTAIEALQYALHLPTSVVITGCESMDNLEQALTAVRTFSESAFDAAAVLARTAGVAASGEFEQFKTSSVHDGTAENPEWLGEESERVLTLQGE